MDQPQPSHLAHHLTGITADLRTRANFASGPRAMLLALIDACFLRIFARLEAIIALWQAGQLPQPSPPNPAPPARPAPRATTPMPEPSIRFRPWRDPPPRAPRRRQALGQHPRSRPHHPRAPRTSRRTPPAPDVDKQGALPSAQP